MASKDKRIEKFNGFLQGKTIKSVSWLGDKDMEELGWYKRPVVIEFTDGSFVIPQCDDEGNDGGSMYYGSEEAHAVIHVA